MFQFIVVWTLWTNQYLVYIPFSSLLFKWAHVPCYEQWSQGVTGPRGTRWLRSLPRLHSLSVGTHTHCLPTGCLTVAMCLAVNTGDWVCWHELSVPDINVYDDRRPGPVLLFILFMDAWVNRIVWLLKRNHIKQNWITCLNSLLYHQILACPDCLSQFSGNLNKSCFFI